MKILVKEGDSQTFLQKYINNDKSLAEFYDYPLNDDGLYSRQQELSERTFNRTELVKTLMNFNRKYTRCEETFDEIRKLEDNNSLVVVGGQQAGLLTGPVYTLNKILSILSEAKKIEEKLNVPVVPIFWIAGEDHDIDEVNHCFFSENSHLKKLSLSEKNNFKIPVSERVISAEEAKTFLTGAIQCLEETEHTKEIYSSLMKDVEEGLTYVEWFAMILHRLFANTGLVLMDSADPEIRMLERPFFKDLIEKNDSLRAAFDESASSFERAGFGMPIERDPNNAHLFVHDQGQRFLLEKQGDQFKEKNGSRQWSQEELLDICEENPALLSNNVVTRPIMQDKLLPVIAFISGPGELKYWGVLQQAFRVNNIRMPLVYPRMHLTLISRRVEKNLNYLHLDPVKVSEQGLRDEMNSWMNNQQLIDVEDTFHKVMEEVKDTLAALSDKLSPLGSDAAELHTKYEALAKKNIQQYEDDVNKVIRNTHAVTLRKFEEIQMEIKPEGNLQERQLNILPFINQYGTDLLTRLLKKLPHEENLAGKHLYIFL